MSTTIRNPDRGKPAFSLTEMAAVMAILMILIAAGASLMAGTGSHSRRTGTDLLLGMLEQARTAAITSRSYVVLAVAEPGDLAAGDERCRLGLFKVEAWPDSAKDPVMGIPLCRWRPLETGISLIGGEIDGVENPMDARKLTIACNSPRPLTVQVHAIAFNPRGGLIYPAGSAPVVIRIAEGVYRAGMATPVRRGPSGIIAENRLKIGRVIARPYRIDG